MDKDDPGHIKIGRKLVVGTPKSPTTHREGPPMETFLVSITGDLLHVYIKYLAESRLAVEQYLGRADVVAA